MYHQDIIREFTVFCSKCCSWERCAGPGQVSYSKAIKYFRSLGWKVLSARWCCPQCLKEKINEINRNNN